MFAGIITPPLIVAGALNLPGNEKAFFISMALFTSGLATLIQVRRIGPIGSGLLSVQGTSFTFLKPALMAGQAGGLPLILGMSLAGAPAEILVSRIISKVKRLFPPIVTGTAVILIGLSLVKVGMTSVGGGVGLPPAEFGSYQNLGLAAFVLFVIVACNRSSVSILRIGSVMLGIVSGYVLSVFLGLVNFESVGQAAFVTLPEPLKYGLAFDVNHFIPWFLAYLVTSVESVGDLTATSLVSDQPISGDVYTKRLAGGTLADALGSVIAAFFNALPNTTFSQNNGVIQLTGVASRQIGYAVAVLLMLTGLCPKIGAVIGLIPQPVLGGATLALFGMVAAAGIRIYSMAELNSRSMLIIALGLSVGLGIEMVPEVLQNLPELVRTTLGTGLITGTLFVLILNTILPED
jgi:NCS2 family nucleobase:cation symporter-2/xanthine permease XanP